MLVTTQTDWKHEQIIISNDTEKSICKTQHLLLVQILRENHTWTMQLCSEKRERNEVQKSNHNYVFTTLSKQLALLKNANGGDWGGRSQLIKPLPHKDEGPEFRTPDKHTCKKPGVIVCGCDPNAGRYRQEDPVACWPASLAEFCVQQETLSQKIR